MAALIPALIKLLMSRRGGGGGGGYSKGGYGGREPKPQRSPEEYSMELLDKNARKAMIQQDDPPGRGRSSSGTAASIQAIMELQNQLIKRYDDDLQE